MKTQFYLTRKRHGPAAVLSALLVALMLAPASGQVPEFGPLQEDYFELGLNPHSEYLAVMFTTLFDIDNDGDLDLFVGENWDQDGATFRLLDFYRNEGDSECPDFQLEESYPFGIPDSSVWVKFADINDDGLPDLFAQKNPAPGFYCILNTGTAEAPLFESDNMITGLPFGLDGSGVAFLYSPVFADLDGDGDYDVFATGRSGGHFLYQENTGTSTEPSFMPPVADPFNLSFPFLPSRELIFPAVADWDCDGDLDIISSVINLADHDEFYAFFHENKYDEMGDIYFEDGVLIGPILIMAQGDLDGEGDLDGLAFEFYSRNTSTHCVTLPEAAFSFDHTEDGQQYGFNNESIVQSTECNPVQWRWDFGDGATSEEEHPTHIYSESGPYETCLTVTDIAGSNTYCEPITVMIGTAQQYRQDAIRLYPNPARDFLYLKFEEDVPANTARVEIFDSWGRLFWKARLGYSSPAQPERIDVASLPEGLYLVKVVAGERFYIGEFVKVE